MNAEGLMLHSQTEVFQQLRKLHQAYHVVSNER